jgi:hypothetical protein
MLKMERILTVDFASTQAQAKKLAPPASRGVAQAGAAVAKSLSASHPVTADWVDRIYRQLAEIHAITTMQLLECAHWCQTDSTPHSTRAGNSQPRSNAVPLAIRLAPSPPTDFSSQAPPW